MKTRRVVTGHADNGIPTFTADEDLDVTPLDYLTLWGADTASA
jgi:hypothetical protein